MNIVLLGYPGSGKGTQAQIISGRFNLMHLSTGDMFREEIARKTPLGEKVQEYLSSGKLVDDRTVMEIIKSKMERYKGGFLFDGFPRTHEQAEALDDLLLARNDKIDAVIFLNVSESVVIDRLGSRRICPKCSKVYNMTTNPPKEDEKCDDCGTRIVQREDDKPEILRKRLMVYSQLTEPLVSYYKSNTAFYEIDGGEPPEKVAEKISERLSQIAGK